MIKAGFEAWAPFTRAQRSPERPQDQRQKCPFPQAHVRFCPDEEAELTRLPNGENRSSGVSVVISSLSAGEGHCQPTQTFLRDKKTEKCNI